MATRIRCGYCRSNQDRAKRKNSCLQLTMKDGWNSSYAREICILLQGAGDNFI
ncbi:hypothetical protein COCSUDRAFT_32076 [Coccomyxa subellipsoidea C-169]|uniref:Uncharacterized protein n=1 Tax=Coccomyxa subellipsoidea (strain C-169) TaxID=574566 RepID=I0ZAM8_COCSC|nr:hypothetical protein COCSUDRAFT_32076 [Coccomyxa subellipsoidea C-169]EIE27697.1 hypothetical protein COCSUDRAFT_32076 [Coccomyxa subellipsoidea C-169]|eukprot:XP_005652241.1 hypothetical protein COCSUDRAFT_32076 [Coccomyxa subellipsoidea C-169]